MGLEYADAVDISKFTVALKLLACLSSELDINIAY